MRARESSTVSCARFWHRPRPQRCAARIVRAAHLFCPPRRTACRAVRRLLFNDQSVDFCFLDGDHTYEAVSEDVRNWFPKIRPGGILAGHDYVSDEHAGVKRAVDEFFRDPATVINGSRGVRKVG